MESQENNTARNDFELIRETNSVLLRKNRALCLIKKHLIQKREMLQKTLNDLTGEQDTGRVPEVRGTDDIDFHQQITNGADYESFCQDNQVLTDKNSVLCTESDIIAEDIDAFQKNINRLTKPTSTVSRVSKNLKVWEKERETFHQRIEVLTKQSCEAKEKQKRALQEKEALQEKVDAITKEVTLNRKAWDQEREILQREIETMKKQKCEVEKETMQVNETLQREVLELQTMSERERELRDTNETREYRLKAELWMPEAVQSIAETVRALQEQVNALRDEVRALRQRLLGHDDSSSEEELSLSSHRRDFSGSSTRGGCTM